MRCLSLSLSIVLTLFFFSITAIELRAQPGKLAKVEFDEATLEEVIDYFRNNAGAGGKPRNILIDPKLDTDVKVTLQLRDVSVGAAFAYVAELAGFDYREDRHALRIFPPRGGKASPKAFLKRGGPMTWRRASEMRMPKVEFESTELGEVVDELVVASRQLDRTKKGLNIILGRGVDPSTPVTLSLRSVPLSTVLKYVAEFARLDLRADGAAILFTNRGGAAK